MLKLAAKLLLFFELYKFFVNYSSVSTILMT